MTADRPDARRRKSEPPRRLQPGEVAPPFEGASPRNRIIKLASYRGRLCWLALFRYAACPFCNWRVHRLTREYPRIQAAGISVIAVFPSPPKRITTYIDRYKPEFDIVADPEEQIYELYRTETSWLGEARAALNVPKAVRIMAFAPNDPTAVDGPIHRMPAEFLLDREQKIAVAHYGTTPDDGIDVDAAVAWASTAP